MPPSSSCVITPSHGSASYGGSISTRPNGPSNLASAFSTRPTCTFPRFASPKASRFDLMSLHRLASLSMKSAEPAPRLSASIPKAPVPAYRSSTSAESTAPGPIIENTAALTRSAVGLRPALLDALRRRPRSEPPVIRVVIGPAPASPCPSAANDCAMLAPFLVSYKGEIQYLFDKWTILGGGATHRLEGTVEGKAGCKPAPTPVGGLWRSSRSLHGRMKATWYKILSANSTYSKYGFWTR